MFAVGNSGPHAAGQKAYEHVYSWEKFLSDCPPGYRLQFELQPDATLYVEKEWLGPSTILELWDRFERTCPTEPISLKSIDFGIKQLNITSGLGRKLLRFNVAGQRPGAHNSSLDWMKGQPEDNGKPHEPGKPWIEDPTLRPPLRKFPNIPTSRDYLIHYPAEDVSGSDTSIVNISCGGGEGRREEDRTELPWSVLRTCDSHECCNFSAGVGYGYIVSQSELPIPDRDDMTSRDPATESGALLQFDMRVRQWLKDIQRKPDR